MLKENKVLNRYLTKDKISILKMLNNQIYAIRELQIKATMSYHHLLNRTATIQNNDDIKC